MLPASSCARPSSRLFTGTTWALTILAFIASPSARSLLVPAMTPIFLPASAISELPSVEERISTPVPSTKVSEEKPTSFMRDKVTLVAPHSMSAWPPATVAKRFCTVTGTHLTCSDAPPSWRSSELTTLRHRSTM